MNDAGLTTMNLKKINKNKVYQFIYTEKATSRLKIVQNLQMGLSTVSQNLKILEEEGLIEKNGFFDSTGGRKAHAISIVRTAKTAIGIGILKDSLHMVAIDLYGNALCQTAISCPYLSEDAYYQRLGQYLEDFILENKLPGASILGVSVTTQGIISGDEQSVSYGVIMKNSDMKLSDFERYIPYPCRLEHDSKAAAYLELWNHRDLKNAVLFLLNPNLGGAVIVNGKVDKGKHMRSGVIEHLCIDQDGPLCYCGKRGCLETCCSADALEEAAGMPVPEFFASLRDNPPPDLTRIWRDYLSRLAFAIRNVNIVIDGDIIISGYLAPFFRREDILYILEQINLSSPFPLSEEQILVGVHGQYTSAIGGALSYVDDFIASV